MSTTSKKRKKFKGKPAPHAGEMVKQLIKDNRFFQSSFARDMGVKDDTILKYFKKPTMQIQTLFDISQVLKYNFFWAIAKALPPEYSPKQENTLQARVDELEKENERLRTEVATLERVIKGS